MELEGSAGLLDGRVVSCVASAPRMPSRAATASTPQRNDRYYRFFTLHPVQLDKSLKLTEPAHGQCALGAFDDDRLIGVAKYLVVCDDPKAAEFAIVVAHEDHSLGVGTALLKHLARVAELTELGGP